MKTRERSMISRKKEILIKEWSSRLSKNFKTKRHKMSKELRRKEVDYVQCLRKMNVTRKNRESKMKNSASAKSNLPKNTPALLNSKSRNVLMKWPIVKNVNANSWTWWQKLSSRTTRKSKRKKISEFLLNTKPENRQNSKMRSKEEKDLWSRRSQRKTTWFNRLPTRRIGKRRRSKGIMSRLRSGRKKPRNMRKLRKKSRSISERWTRNMRKFWNLCSKLVKVRPKWTEMSFWWTNISWRRFLRRRASKRRVSNSITRSSIRVDVFDI